jgi:hypothetical protein
LGGGRNLDFDAETTIELAQTEIIQNKLEQLLKYFAQSKNVNSASMEWNRIGNSKSPLSRNCLNVCAV